MTPQEEIQYLRRKLETLDRTAYTAETMEDQLKLEYARQLYNERIRELEAKR